MHRAFLSLGSNQDAERHLSRALDELRERFGAMDVSPVYRTPALGFDGPDFLNLAVVLGCDLDAPALDAWLHSLEDEHGRRRDVPRFSSRPLDIDIVFFDDVILRGPGHLQIPRDDLQHAFVLKPLADIAPDFVHPGNGSTLAHLWRKHPQFKTPPLLHLPTHDYPHLQRPARTDK